MSTHTLSSYHRNVTPLNYKLAYAQHAIAIQKNTWEKSVLNIYQEYTVYLNKYKTTIRKTETNTFLSVSMCICKRYVK